ncbi:MAG: NAD(P)-dependent glycerol-3-phosphate dehydrogenase [Phycisphaerae bacterium]|jgi:glycerol-3-phosphate dehydrogenase (NAD(P)+)|nr:NAD(P)-dependent glycerol-3-phosphate dehydrogenase [Phycisphaerae bacterium]
MALVLADLLTFKGIPARLWSPFPQAASELARARRSPRLSGFELPATVVVTPDPEEAFRQATLLVNAIPTQYIRRTWTTLHPFLPPGAPIVSVAKGIETETLRRPTEILAEVTGAGRSCAVLSGPTIAAELARRLPAVMVAASADAALSERTQAVFGAPWVRIYTNDDALGVELAGALKNVIAIAAGIVDGVGLGSNAKSALLARGLVEIARFGVAIGAKTETFFGVSGVGDLATTCFSPEGRNRSFGEAVARGDSLAGLLDAGATGSIVEGAPTAKAVHQWAKRLGISMPITDAVFAMVFEGLSPREAVGELMRRATGPERVG